MLRRSGLQAEVCNPLECGSVMSPISKFTRKELGKDIQMFVLLDQVHTAMAYLNWYGLLFIVRAYHFENDCQKMECHVQRVLYYIACYEPSSY